MPAGTDAPCDFRVRAIAVSCLDTPRHSRRLYARSPGARVSLPRHRSRPTHRGLPAGCVGAFAESTDAHPVPFRDTRAPDLPAHADSRCVRLAPARAATLASAASSRAVRRLDARRYRDGPFTASRRPFTGGPARDRPWPSHAPWAAATPHPKPHRDPLPPPAPGVVRRGARMAAQPSRCARYLADRLGRLPSRPSAPLIEGTASIGKPLKGCA